MNSDLMEAKKFSSGTIYPGTFKDKIVMINKITPSVNLNFKWKTLDTNIKA